MTEMLLSTDVLVIVLLTFLVWITFVIAQQKNLFAAVMMLGIFSLLSAALFTVMDAVDVAFTEAAVGAGISTVLMLATLALTTFQEDDMKRTKRQTILPLAVVLLTGAALIYGTFDMPHYGDPEAPIHQHVAPQYLTESYEKTHIPNIVTTVLASYRGYDTFGETTVIFTAAVGVLLLLGGRKKKGEDG